MNANPSLNTFISVGVEADLSDVPESSGEYLNSLKMWNETSYFQVILQLIFDDHKTSGINFFCMISA